jgi:hypothetical protein
MRCPRRPLSPCARATGTNSPGSCNFGISSLDAASCTDATRKCPLTVSQRTCLLVALMTLACVAVRAGLIRERTRLGLENARRRGSGSSARPRHRRRRLRLRRTGKTWHGIRDCAPLLRGARPPTGALRDVRGQHRPIVPKTVHSVPATAPRPCGGALHGLVQTGGPSLRAYRHLRYFSIQVSKTTRSKNRTRHKEWPSVRSGTLSHANIRSANISARHHDRRICRLTSRYKSGNPSLSFTKSFTTLRPALIADSTTTADMPSAAVNTLAVATF